MAGRRLTLNDLLNDDRSPDCFPLSLPATSARRTPSPPRGRYDLLADARMSASAGSSGGMSSHSRSPGVPFPGRHLTGPGYSPSMCQQQQLPQPPQQHSPSPLEALIEAASAEQRRMNDESARRSSADAAECSVPPGQRKRKRPSDPTPALPPPPPPRLTGPGMQPSELIEKEREVIALMSAAPDTVGRTPGPRRPWEDAPTAAPAGWRPPDVAQPQRHVELAPMTSPSHGSPSSPPGPSWGARPSLNSASTEKAEPVPEPPPAVPAPPASPVPATPALDADEELARSLDAQLNRRARPERERRRTEKLRDNQPDLEVLLAQAERERAAAPSKNRARDRKKHEEEATVKGKDDGERGRENTRSVAEDDELDAELLSLVGDRPSPAPARAREALTATASPPPPSHTKAELERESMPPPPSPDEGSTTVPKKRGPGRPPGAKNRNSINTPASAVSAKKKPALKKSTPGARSRSSSVMPMPSSSLAHEVKFDTDDDEPERGVLMEVDRAPEPEDAIAQAWAQREERERAKKEEKEREKAAREARKRETKERVTEKENRKEKGQSDEDEEDDKLYCVCKMPYDDENVMIACDRCDEWYHTTCVDMPDSEIDLVDQFICPPCIEKEPHLNLRTTYKRRCQRGLEDDGACNKPSRGTLSKYCSDACGIAAVRSRICAWNGDRAALWESVRGAERREGVVVRVLDGVPLPNPAADAQVPNTNGNRPPTMTVNGDSIVVLPSKPRASRTLARLRSQLDGVVAQRENLTRALESASWRQRLLELATARADADSSTCGWDQRMCFGDAEIAEFGGDVFASYERDAARRAERAASEATDGEREGSGEDEDEENEENESKEKGAEKMDVDGEEDEAQWWCNGRKKCDRHAGWQKLRETEVEFDLEMKELALERLTKREREIRGRVEDILDPHAAPAASAQQVGNEVGTPEPVVNGHAHGGAARVNGVDAVAKKSKKLT